MLDTHVIVPAINKIAEELKFIRLELEKMNAQMAKRPDRVADIISQIKTGIVPGREHKL